MVRNGQNRLKCLKMAEMAISGHSGHVQPLTGGFLTVFCWISLKITKNRLKTAISDILFGREEGFWQKSLKIIIFDPFFGPKMHDFQANFQNLPNVCIYRGGWKRGRQTSKSGSENGQNRSKNGVKTVYFQHFWDPGCLDQSQINSPGEVVQYTSPLRWSQYTPLRWSQCTPQGVQKTQNGTKNHQNGSKKPPKWLKKHQKLAQNPMKMAQNP